MPRTSTRTTTATANVPAKAGVTALADIRAQLAAEVAHLKDQIGKPSGSKIRLKDKTFSFPDGTLDGGPITLAIVDFVSRNHYYVGKYDPKSPALPVCFAVGKNLKDMKPSPNSPEPQASSCADCPNNQFGSDGRGKACKNTRYLAVLPPDNTDATTELMTLEVSPTGIKKFDALIATLANQNRNPMEVSVDVAFDERYEYDTLTFNNTQELPEEVIIANFGRRAEAESILTVEPDFAPAPAKQAPARRPTRRAA